MGTWRGPCAQPAYNRPAATGGTCSLNCQSQWAGQGAAHVILHQALSSGTGNTSVIIFIVICCCLKIPQKILELFENLRIIKYNFPSFINENSFFLRAIKWLAYVSSGRPSIPTPVQHSPGGPWEGVRGFPCRNLSLCQIIWGVCTGFSLIQTSFNIRPRTVEKLLEYQQYQLTQLLCYKTRVLPHTWSWLLAKI